MKRRRPQIIETGGKWDRSIRPRYFIAGAILPVSCGACVNGPIPMDVLLAVNEIKNNENSTARFNALLEGGSTILMDSGCFSLANGHATKHGIDVVEALSMQPDELDGFDKLFADYVELVTRVQDRVWGYIEVDIGGREGKMRTREKLEAMGLRPIPVFHPFADGPDYFDYLAERYDRICLANLGTAPPPTRKRIVATYWDRKQKYPHLWIHALGLSPSPLMLAFPMDSCDSSAWHGGVRWGDVRSWAGTQQLWPTDRRWLYIKGVVGNRSGASPTAYTMLGADACLMSRTMQQMLRDQRAAVGAGEIHD